MNIIKMKEYASFFIIWLILLLILITNYSNGDYEGYQIMYNNCLNKVYWVEPGYVLSEVFFYNMGFTFSEYRTVIMSICWLLVGYSIFRISKASTFILILYGIFPFSFDTVQIRNFFSLSIAVYAIRFLEEEAKTKVNKQNILYYILFVAVASSFQYAAMVFFLFLPLIFISESKVAKCSFILAPIVFIYILFFPPEMLVEIIRFITTKNISNVDYGVLSCFLWFSLGYLLEIYIFFNGRHDEDISIYRKISYCSILFLPLILLNFDLYRIYRNLCLVNYIVLIKSLPKYKVSFNYIIAILFVFILFVSQLSPRNEGNYRFVTIPIVNDTYFFKIIGISLEE